MLLTDDTDVKVRRLFKKVCKWLDRLGTQYEQNEVFRLCIILSNFEPKEIADAFISARQRQSERAECN